MSAPVTLVVGAAQGIGRATALTLASSGHRVVLADRDLDGVHETAAMLNDPAPSYRLDIRDREAVDTVIADIERTHGPIDGLAHVAGVFSVASILDCDPDEWQRIHDINVTGLVSVLRAVGRAMRDRRSGSIVVVGSNSAGVPRMGMGAYGSSKAAATMLVRILGLELAQYGIRANIVAPGSTDTAMQRTLWADPDDNDGASARSRATSRSSRSGFRWDASQTPSISPTRSSSCSHRVHGTSPCRPCTSTAVPH